MKDLRNVIDFEDNKTTLAFKEDLSESKNRGPGKPFCYTTTLLFPKNFEIGVVENEGDKNHDEKIAFRSIDKCLKAGDRTLNSTPQY